MGLQNQRKQLYYNQIGYKRVLLTLYNSTPTLNQSINEIDEKQENKFLKKMFLSASKISRYRYCKANSTVENKK